MQRLWAVLIVVVMCAGCLDGRAHIQNNGDYALLFVDSEIIKDTCGVLAKQPIAEGTLRSLWNANLTVLGDTVRMRTDLYEIQLVGDYHKTFGRDQREHFTLDGSTNNAVATIAGSECLVDIVTVHLEANTVDADRFTGVVSVRYDTRQPASCNCEYLVNFRAARQTTP